MKAVVRHGTGDVPVDEVPDPRNLEPGDAIVRGTRGGVRGAGLRPVRGVVEGAVLAHEGGGTGGVGVHPRPDRPETVLDAA
ncbi:hypothetical protein [Saccharothrix australiensis]|uniref:Alcohol dehydrogenase-like protein n=1 Tax=Saccharothrix australiensis TaxID=2072 RepID=A0A495W2U9_9PSEU|nr:hypothetical protein [Saccharothrix australiensis]RKT55976.1 alcohol dehydrogenase-like protein [Saccharothrix australiensis]